MAHIAPLLLIAALGASTATAEECSFPQKEPVQQSGKTEYLFLDTCGKPYEVGYRLDGSTLHFPKGGKHALPKADNASAEQVLREAYGLVGEREKLIRTKF